MELKWNKTCAILKPTIQVEITKEDVLDIICSAVNGGVEYWGATSANDEDYSEAKKHLVEQGEDLKDICYEEVFAQILFDGKSLEITDIENDKKYFLSLEKSLSDFGRQSRKATIPTTTGMFQKETGSENGS